MANFAVVSGQAAMVTAGTAVQLVASTVAYRWVRSILIKADVDNTDDIFIGNDNAGDVTVSNGYQLKPGDSVQFNMDDASPDGDERIDISTFWIDCAAGTPNVHFLVLTG